MSDQHRAVGNAVANTDAALARLQSILSDLSDADLHRAHRNGGWSVAQVVSHINLSALVWVAAIQRLRADPDLDFVFREEIGHDAVGYPPSSVEVAVAQLDSTRATVNRSAVDDAVGARTVTIPDLGTMTVTEWEPLILGHITGHVEQAIEILADRDVLPAGVA